MVLRTCQRGELERRCQAARHRIVVQSEPFTPKPMPLAARFGFARLFQMKLMVYGPQYRELGALLGGVWHSAGEEVETTRKRGEQFMTIRWTAMPIRFWRTTAVLALCYWAALTCAQAQCMGTTQTQGFNTVYGCSNAEQGSYALVDASQFSGNICAQIQSAFTTYLSPTAGVPPYGIVIDARSINSGMTCSGSPWPNVWYKNTALGILPSVVLLPSGTITLQAPWVMPASSRLIGEGPGNTTLKASFTNGDMIDMGSSNNNFCNPAPGNSYDCAAVEIEHLSLDGNCPSSSNCPSNVNGIVNYYAQELSYVEDVAFSNIKGTALTLNGNNATGTNYAANNSGPYSNLTMTGVGTCVGIYGTSGTRGIHGLTCTTSSSSTSSAAIYVDGANNSLEDITLVGGGGNTNGILIGGSAPGLTNGAPAANNILFNISGTNFTNLIAISNQTPSSGPYYCPAKTQGGSSRYNACDIIIMGLANGSAGGSNITISDQVGSVSLLDAQLGMYILGEPVQMGSSSNSNNTFLGYSHFTTSPNWPAWVVGTSQTNGSGCSGVGSLFSATSGSGGTLWECERRGVADLAICEVGRKLLGRRNKTTWQSEIAKLLLCGH